MRIKIQFFRSIVSQDVELRPITLLYGENGAGKSSLIYALMTLKNIVTNPSQLLDDLFRYGTIHLGGFTNVESLKDFSPVELVLEVKSGHHTVRYKVNFQNLSGSSREYVYSNLGLNSDNDTSSSSSSFDESISVSFPYYLDTKRFPVSNYEGHSIEWNGIAAQVKPKDSSQLESAKALAEDLNAPMETLRRTTLVPLVRGFTKPVFSTVSMTSLLDTEDEIATFLATNSDVVDKLSFYLEQIFRKKFQVNFAPGTSIFSLDIIDDDTALKLRWLTKDLASIKSCFSWQRRCTQASSGFALKNPKCICIPKRFVNLPKS